MTKSKILTEIEELRAQILEHNNAYYTLDAPKISDFEYDELMRRLKQLESENPQFLTKTSPTQVVGGKVLANFGKISHATPMLSLEDAMNVEALKRFDNRVKTALNGGIRYIVQPKIDGLSIALTYENGKLTSAATRGDGTVGEDVTANILACENIPSEIGCSTQSLVVRGEVYMAQSTFKKYVMECEENGVDIPRNPRNAAAGAVRQKNPEVTKSRGLSIFCFSIMHVEGAKFNGICESLEFLKACGLPVVDYEVCDDIEQVIDFIENLGTKRSELDFDIDGAVVAVDDYRSHEILGVTSKFPRWAAAFKYPPEEKSTTLREIEITVGRTGALTPTAVFEPIVLAGTEVRRAVLHNQDYINSLDVAVGDEILVRKAGDIIPEVVKVLKRPTPRKTYVISDICPSCGEKVVRLDGESAVKCINIHCKSRVLRSLSHFCARGAMDIIGLGKKIVELLVNNNLIENVADIYTLKLDDLATLERMGEKSAGNILASIERSKDNDLWRLLFGLGIGGIGATASRNIAQSFGDLDAVMLASAEDIANLDGVGAILAQSIVDFFREPSNNDLINRLKSYGVNTKSLAEKVDASGIFNDEIFVLTGKLPTLTRDQAAEKIMKNGGTVSSSVSSKTTYVLAGEKGGSKLEKAAKLGVKIIDEDELNAILMH